MASRVASTETKATRSASADRFVYSLSIFKVAQAGDSTESARVIFCSACCIISRSFRSEFMAVILRNCPHCPAENSSFPITWTAPVPQLPRVWNCAATCGACSGPICFRASTVNPGMQGHPPINHAGNIEPDYMVSDIWPTRKNATAPPHTPGSVKARFLEGEDAFSRKRWNSAIAMYRSALDIATKGMQGVPTGTFFQRLVWLSDNHAITPDIRSWADHVRVEGNAALHDPEEFVESDAKALRFFTEMFLRYVFELPGAVREFRGEPAQTTPPIPG